MAEIKNSEPTEINISNFNSARDNLNATYESEQKKYIQNKIDETTNATTNQKSSEAWKAVNEITGRKTTNKAKLKAKNETERVILWKEHFQKLLGLQPTSENVNVTPIIDNDLGIKSGNFTMDELKAALQNTQYAKACSLDNIPGEVWKLDDFSDILLQLCNAGLYTIFSKERRSWCSV